MTEFISTNSGGYASLSVKPETVKRIWDIKNKRLETVGERLTYDDIVNRALDAMQQGEDELADATV